MKVKILKSSHIIGNRSYLRGDVVDVSYDEETTKRMLKLGNFAPAPGAKAVNEPEPGDLEEDEDDEDPARPQPPTRAIPRQPKPRMRKPLDQADDDEGDHSAE